MRDPEIIRRDVQIANLMAENLQLRAERNLANAQAAMFEASASCTQILKERDALVAELAATRRVTNPPPPATPPSGAPLVVEDPVAPVGT